MRGGWEKGDRWVRATVGVGVGSKHSVVITYVVGPTHYGMSYHSAFHSVVIVIVRVRVMVRVMVMVRIGVPFQIHQSDPN